MKCDCKVLTKLIMDLRKSMREEQAAVDDYFERGRRAEEAEIQLDVLPEDGNTIYDLANLYRAHVMPEEQQHQEEFEEALAALLKFTKGCNCDSSFMKDRGF